MRCIILALKNLESMMNTVTQKKCVYDVPTLKDWPISQELLITRCTSRFTPKEMIKKIMNKSLNTFFGFTVNVNVKLIVDEVNVNIFRMPQACG